MKILPIAATLAVFAATSVHAQGYPSQAGAATPQGRGSPPGAGGGAYDLHAALRLSPGQESAWATLNAATSPDPRRQAMMRDEMGRLAQMTTPQRLDVTQGEMRRDAEDFSRRAGAIRAFYAQLSPAQQATFDRLTGPPPGGGRGPPPR